ncbi:hypothetical protein BDN67DRAFT_966590 [Paxillus ammoniavirescens]|nr:hypothetical protein BDN67DRAFT_966590 [Paxillus ammoniavirescens]
MLSSSLGCPPVLLSFCLVALSPPRFVITSSRGPPVVLRSSRLMVTPVVLLYYPLVLSSQRPVVLWFCGPPMVSFCRPLVLSPFFRHPVIPCHLVSPCRLVVLSLPSSRSPLGRLFVSSCRPFVRLPSSHDPVVLVCGEGRVCVSEHERAAGAPERERTGKPRRARASGREQQDLPWSGSPLVLWAVTEVGVSVRLVNANMQGG